MTDLLELADIQGNILSAYGRLGFPKARYLLVHIANAPTGRAFVEALRRRVTTALRWPSSRKGVPLEPAAGGVVPAGFIHAHAPHPDALDSRYAIAGLVRREAVVGRAVVLF